VELHSVLEARPSGTVAAVMFTIACLECSLATTENKPLEPKPLLQRFLIKLTHILRLVKLPTKFRGAGEVTPQQVFDYFEQNPNVQGLPSSFGKAQIEYHNATHPGWGPLAKDVGVGTALGAGAGAGVTAGGGAVLDAGRALGNSLNRRASPLSHGLSQVKSLPKDQPDWYSAFNRNVSETMGTVKEEGKINQLSDVINGMPPEQQKALFRESSGPWLQRMLGGKNSGPTGPSSLGIPGGENVPHEAIRALGRYSAPVPAGEGLWPRTKARLGVGGALGGAFGGAGGAAYRGIEKLLSDPTQEVLNEHPELFKAQ
jgi:hypothetical protein